MSGGHWNYEQRKISLIAESLLEERDPVLRACGAHLIEITECLERADRCYSHDDTEWDDARGRLSRLIGSERISIETMEYVMRMISSAHEAISELTDMLEEQ